MKVVRTIVGWLTPILILGAGFAVFRFLGSQPPPERKQAEKPAAAPVNAVVREANNAIHDVCTETGAAYLPVYERLTDLLASQGAISGPAWTGSWVPGVASLVEHFALGRSYDAIALARGWVISPDGVHMDSTGASIIADLAADWLERQSSTA